MSDRSGKTHSWRRAANQQMNKFVFNCSINVLGGGVQESVNFILESLKDGTVEWNYIVSPQVKRELDRYDVHLDNSLVVERSPARSRATRSYLARHVKELGVDAVLTLAGPAYVDFGPPHLMGIANAFITHASLGVLFRSGWIHALTVIYRTLFVRKSDAWLFQTASAKKGFARRFRVPEDSCYVVPNSIGRNYSTKGLGMENTLATGPEDTEVVVLVPAADYPHKNVRIVPEIAHSLRSLIPAPGVVRFLLTLPENSETWKAVRSESDRLNVSDMIENHGPFSINDGPELYARAHIMLLPTKLETFSANYLDAMATNRLIITSNKDFARDVCGNGALYFEPDRPSECARQIADAISNPAQCQELLRRGRERLDQFPDIAGRYALIKKALEDMIPPGKSAR